MKIKRSRLTVGMALCLFLGGLLLTALLTPITYAGTDLPDRATPTASKRSSDSTPTGAYIILSSSAGSWAVVEWQDSDDQWHIVEGWQGSLSNGTLQWWVAPKDFGTGPFRWVVQQGSGGPTTAVSEPFYLPQAANDVVWVTAE